MVMIMMITNDVAPDNLPETDDPPSALLPTDLQENDTSATPTARVRLVKNPSSAVPRAQLSVLLQHQQHLRRGGGGWGDQTKIANLIGNVMGQSTLLQLFGELRVMLKKDKNQPAKMSEYSTLEENIRRQVTVTYERSKIKADESLQATTHAMR